MFFDEFLGSSFSSLSIRDNDGRLMSEEIIIKGLVPERTVNKKNIKNVTNNFFGNDSPRKVKRNAVGGNNGGFDGDEFDTVDVHENNLNNAINDYVISRAKKGYVLRSKKNVKEGVMITTKNKRNGLEHARLFKVYR